MTHEAANLRAPPIHPFATQCWLGPLNERDEVLRLLRRDPPIGHDETPLTERSTIEFPPTAGLAH